MLKHKSFLSTLVAVIVTSMLAVACTKTGNPNGLPEDVNSSEYVGNKNPRVVKILAIGNSFSEDAVESHLYELAKANGDSVVIGNLYIGGASLDLHVTNAERNASVYSYRKVIGGVKKTYEKVSIATALAEEPWDYISFQQVSQNSGQFSTFQEKLPRLYNFVKSKVSNHAVKYVLHQTWAYAQNSTHEGFINYNKNQMAMYDSIVNAYNKAKALLGSNVVIVPTGTAIQNARTSLVGDNFTRDGYHLSIPYGRYVAACTWYETIFGKTVVDNKYHPSELSDFEASIAQNAAHYACLKPNEVTQMTAFQGTGDFTGFINLNFGTATPPTGWNGLTSFMEGTSVALKNNTNNYTGVSAVIIERFNGANTSGESTTTTELDMPSAVSSSAFYGNAKGVFGGLLITKGTIKITGLNKNKTYSLCYYGSRNSSTDNRETKFITTGANEVVVNQNSANNKTTVSWAENVYPNDNGEITITVTAGSNNTNSFGFFYINALRIKQNN